MKLNAKQLRATKPSEADWAGIERKPIYIVLDNVLDTYNIGSIFRLADAVAASEVILCGGSETPPSSRIHKAAVGTEEWVKWRYIKGSAFRNTFKSRQSSDFKSGDWRLLRMRQRLWLNRRRFQTF